MAQAVVNVGTQPNDATGDLLRDAFVKINTNFAALFSGTFPAAQLVVGPPVSGVALTVQAFPGSNAANFIGGSGSFGAISIRDGQAGTTLWTISAGVSAAGDFNIVNSTAGTTPIKVSAAGAITLTGAVNAATSLAVAGTPVLTSAVTSLAGTANQVAVSASTGAVTVSLSPNVVIPTPATGDAFTVNGLGGANAARINGSSSAGNSFGLSVVAGTNASDNAVRVFNQAVTSTFLSISGDGHGTLGPSSTLGLAWAVSGNVSIPAPSSGDNLLLTNVAGGNALTIAGNSAGTAVLRLNTQATTGAQTATFLASNKPGTGTTGPDKWIPFNLDGTTHYVPAFL
jgi:hypothetical protein